MFQDFGRRLQRDIKKRVDRSVNSCHLAISLVHFAIINGLYYCKAICTHFSLRSPCFCVILHSRMQGNIDKLGHAHVGTNQQDIDVKVLSHDAQQYAVWLGGSILASTDQFYAACYTKAQYEEQGPSIARHNVAFKAKM